MDSPREYKTADFHDGRPIKDFAEDSLGRKAFSRFFAEAITRYSGQESLVLAINAPWGEGKTSLKNMVTSLLEQEHRERIVTLTFTPWEWASQNQVSEAFFAEIAKQLELKDHSESFRSDDAEVNPSDLFVLETLRLFEPVVYAKIQGCSKKLFPLWEITMLSRARGEKDPWQETLNELAQDGSGKIEQRARQLIQYLLPQRSPTGAPYGPTLESQELARERRLCHILYFNRYFRLTIDEDDVADSVVSRIASLMSTDALGFVHELRQLASASKLSLTLTKLLARQNLAASTTPIQMITATCNFAEEIGDPQQPSEHIRIRSAFHRIIDLQLPKELSSEERLARLCSGISASDAIHFPIQIAESEDRTEHQASSSAVKERQELGSYLARAEITKFNAFVAARLETAITKGQLTIGRAWVESVQWYFYFVQKRAGQNAKALLSTPAGLAVVLQVLINDQTTENYDVGPAAHFAETPMYLAKHLFGFDPLDKALVQHETELSGMGLGISKRIQVYRDMRARLSNLADKPNQAHETQDEE